MEPVPHCVGFAVDCGTMLKGIGVIAMALTLFVGSVYLLLTAIFGRYMGFLVLIVAFSGWMIVQSSLWLFGFYSQGITTPTNLGPRGSEPAWIVLQASPGATSDKYTTFSQFPNDPWHEADLNDDQQTADVQSAGGAVSTFLTTKTNEQLGLAEDDPTAITTTGFTIDDLKFAVAEDGKTPIAVVQAHYNGGGPLWTVSLYHDSGSVPRYSYMFLAGSILIFAIFLPLLDRAEKKRKEFLVGGSAPAWYGPA
jgi:hypothetical protein